MYEQHLIQAGLSNDQAQIYEILLKNGPLKAGKISQKTPLKRGLVYKILDQLVEFGLIEKNEEAGKVAVFIPGHPLKIKDLIEQRQKQAKDAELAISGVLPSIISDFNLISGRPGVQVYEGRDGAIKVNNDSLKSKTEICSFIDSESLYKIYPGINDEYVKERIRLKIMKKNIMLDSDYVRSHAPKVNREYTDTHLIQGKDYFFPAVMHIYDNKVGYITLRDKMMGIIIEDEYIANLHKNIFKYLWENTPSLFSIEKREDHKSSMYQLPENIS